MKIVILSMDDPLQTNQFIKNIIDNYRDEIALYVEVTKGSRLTIGKKRSKFLYLLTIFIIMGFGTFITNSVKSVVHKVKKAVSLKLNLNNDGTNYTYCNKLGIKTIKTTNPNSKVFREILIKLQPDLIINQSQCIIKRKLINIPKIGIINRHNALLPKNRGRLTPFWVLYKNEKETGVTIHFVDEGIDSGDIIIQKKFTVPPNISFAGLVDLNYLNAKKAMLEAIELLKSGDYASKLLENSDDDASYNGPPTLKDALMYRCRKKST